MKPVSYLQPPKPPADTRFFIRLSSLSYGELAGLLAMAWAFGFCCGFLLGFRP